MIYVSVNYNYSPDFDSPGSWFKRISSYIGILESLAKKSTVIYVTQINYKGDYIHNSVQGRFVDFGKKDTFFPFKLNRYIKSLNPDVLLLQGLHNPLQFIQLALFLKKSTKVIAHHHAEKPFMGIKKQLQKLADRYIDAYMFASRSLGMDWFKAGIINNADKIHEVMEVSSIFYPIERTVALSKTKIKANPAFLWVGRLNANKDPLNVIKAFLRFTKTYREAKLYMIYHTNDMLSEITELLTNNLNKNAIVLIGKVPKEELLYWYNSVDFIVSGSHYEGSGTAICEAMSCGCIPVVTDIFSFRMITDNGKCGLLYEAGNEDALLSTLFQIQRLDISEMRNLCLDYFKANLSFEAIADRMQDIAGLLK